MTESQSRTITKRELVNRIAEETDLTKVAVRDVIQSFLDSIVESEEVIVIGSLAEEWTVGIEAIREGMSSSGGTVKYLGRDLHDSQLEMSTDRMVGWLTERADLHYDVNGEKKSLMGFRATSVWEHFDGEWKMVNFHGSMPDTANDF